MRSKAVYLASSRILTRRASQKTTGSRDILGIWIEQTEGAKFWMKVFTDLKTRGCQDILIAVTDGLKGMSEALAAVFPDAQNAPTGGLGKPHRTRPQGDLEKPHRTRFPTAPTRIVINALHTKNLTLLRRLLCRHPAGQLDAKNIFGYAAFSVRRVA